MVTFKLHSTDPYNMIGAQVIQDVYKLAKRGLCDYWIRYGKTYWDDEIDIIPTRYRVSVLLQPQAA